MDYRTCDLNGSAVIYAVASTEGIRAGLSESSLWLSLWGHIAEGREIAFVHSLVEFARSIKKTRVVMGADEFHVVSGVPMTSPSGLRLMNALNSAGFKGMEVADYVGDLSSAATNSYIESGKELIETRSLRFTTCDDDARLDALEVFISKEFPGRWTRELQVWRKREDTDRAFWMSLEDTSGIIGFARMAIRGRVKAFDQGWTPGAMRLPLRSAVASSYDDSCLGPIGIAASQRGQGTGKALLGLVLRTLRENHAARVCIDWTNAFKYYEPLEYKRARRIWTSWKDEL
ncbi:MAG: GNAT family N-acetyltransferase [Bdellovibrionota bacterium]